MKIKLNQCILMLLLIVSFFSCSKETPLNTAGPVQFLFNGTINNNSVKFEAGENNYFLNTDYLDASANAVLLMKGEFVNKADSSADVLRFEFYGYDEQDNSNILQNVFSPGGISSTSTDSVISGYNGSFDFQFDALNNPAMSHVWDFGDGSTGTGASVTHSYNVGAPVDVKLITTIQQLNCTDSVTNSINTDDLNCQIQFETLPVTIDSFDFEAPFGFTSYTWLVNGVDQMVNNRLISQSFVNPLRRVVQLTATQANCSSSWKAVIIPDSNSGCFAGFKFTTLQQPVPIYSPRSTLKTAVITYETNGKVYKSQKVGNANQSNNVVFTVVNASAYDDNPAGQKTISLNGNMDTFLYNVSDPNDSIPIVSSNVRIAVAHP